MVLGLLITGSCVTQQGSLAISRETCFALAGYSITRSMIIPGYQAEMCEKVSIAVLPIATHTTVEKPKE